MLCLIKEQHPNSGQVINIMSDVAILTALVKTTLLEMSKQEFALGAGLQNAAPGDRTGAPNPTVQYLLASAELLQEMAKQCDNL